MPLEITADWITAVAAIAALVVTIIIAWRQISIQKKQATIMETQTKIASQQLDLINYQEQERRTDRLQARFEARVIHKKVRDYSVPYLQIENKGPAEARDIEMSLIDVSSELPVKFTHEVPRRMSSIPSGVSLDFFLSPRVGGAPPFYYLKISWTDGLDEMHLKKIPFRL